MMTHATYNRDTLIIDEHNDIEHRLENTGVPIKTVYFTQVVSLENARLIINKILEHGAHVPSIENILVPCGLADLTYDVKSLIDLFQRFPHAQENLELFLGC